MFLSQLIYVYVHMHPSIHLLALSCVLSFLIPAFLPYKRTQFSLSAILVHWPSQCSWCTLILQLRQAQFACYRQCDNHHELESSRGAQSLSRFDKHQDWWCQAQGQSRLTLWDKGLSWWHDPDHPAGCLPWAVMKSLAAKRLLQRYIVMSSMQSGWFLHTGWSTFKPLIQAWVHTVKSNCGLALCGASRLF